MSILKIGQKLKFVLLIKAIDCFVLIIAVYYFMSPQPTVAANQDLSKNKALYFSAMSSVFVDNYRSNMFSGMQKADYFLQFKQQELDLVQKAEKEKILALNTETKTIKAKIALNKILIEKKAPIQKVLIEAESLKVLITAYSSTSDQTDGSPFVTASNKHVFDGVIAANFLPFGTKVKFPSLFGDKEFVVEDRMKSNSKVDIWFPDRQSALRFGVKRAEMVIVSRPDK